MFAPKLEATITYEKPLLKYKRRHGIPTYLNNFPNKATVLRRARAFLSVNIKFKGMSLNNGWLTLKLLPVASHEFTLPTLMTLPMLPVAQHIPQLLVLPLLHKATRYFTYSTVGLGQVFNAIFMRYVMRASVASVRDLGKPQINQRAKIHDFLRPSSFSPLSAFQLKVKLLIYSKNHSCV